MADHRSDRSSPAPAHSKKRKMVTDLESVCDTAWNHWQSYLENEEDSDELVELIGLLRPHCCTSSSLSDDGGEETGAAALSATAAKKTKSLAPMKTTAGRRRTLSSRVDLLPAMMSVAASTLAEIAISDGLAATVHSRLSEDELNEPEQQTESRWNELHQYLQLAFSFRDDPFPNQSSSLLSSLFAVTTIGNPGCWSMVANYARMSERISVPRIIWWYLHAAEASRRLRREAIDALQPMSLSLPQPPQPLDDDTKAWIESLILNQMVGVELEEPMEKDDVDTVGSGNIVRAREDNEGRNPEFEDRWSRSTVEATSRFMAAMLLSTIQQHDAALRELKRLDVTHRLHPNVWTGQISNTGLENSGTAPHKRGDDSVEVRVYGVESEGFLPKALYDRLCLAFAPDSPYWDETDYSNRGYYSYFMDLDANSAPPLRYNNLIHHVVSQYILPAVESLRSEGDDSIVGYEWWVHTRSVNASLGHNLHFDTDEAILNRTGKIYHPVYSSVLYLTGDSRHAGATIVLDQTPEASSNATRCWRNMPVPNSLLVFPGNLLHGVLPCPGDHQCHASGDATEGRFDASLSSLPNISELDWLLQTTETNGNLAPSSHHRLTLLVGFWTRRVPDHVQTNLYGPCGPLPPVADYRWVQELCHGYDESTMSLSTQQPSSSTVVAPEGRAVPCVSPAWEEIHRCNEKDENHDEEGSLPIPSGILDHRYFVKDAPQCFWAALFDRDGDDDEEEEHDADNIIEEAEGVL